MMPWLAAEALLAAAASSGTTASAAVRASAAASRRSRGVGRPAPPLRKVGALTRAATAVKLSGFAAIIVSSVGRSVTMRVTVVSDRYGAVTENDVHLRRDVSQSGDRRRSSAAEAAPVQPGVKGVAFVTFSEPCGG